jgi:nitroreductase
MAALTSEERNAALDLLLNRRSCHQLIAPAPGEEELALILQAALRTPDFGHLRPFRFLAAQGEGLDRLGLAMQRAAIAANKPEKIIARAPGMPHRAPLVIVVVAQPKPDKTVPDFDQILCAACTVLMMQLAARALGYGGIWRSGWMMYDSGFRRELGLDEQAQIVGFLYLGTPGLSEETDFPSEDPFGYVSWI